jgi:hypothetical protein
MLVNLESRVAKGVCGYFTTAQHMTFAKMNPKKYTLGSLKFLWQIY